MKADYSYTRKLERFLIRSTEINERLLELLNVSVVYELEIEELEEIESLRREVLYNYLEAFRLN